MGENDMRAALLALSMMASALPTIAGQPEGAAVLLTRAFPSLTMIYTVPGVTDSGGASDTGVATTLHCLNIDAAIKQIQVVYRGSNGALVSAHTYNVNPKQDFTVSTHSTVVFGEDTTLATGTGVRSGSFAISATSPNFVCTAMVVDAAATVPNGIALHMMRRNPVAGSQE